MEAPQDTTSLVAKAVKAAMTEAGWTESAMAEATGIAQQTLNRHIRGIAPFRVDHLGLIARELGMTVAELISTRRAA